MSAGPGKYDDLCTYVREQAKATVALVIIIDGDKGAGFSMQAPSIESGSMLPELLEYMAQQIREDLTKGGTR